MEPLGFPVSQCWRCCPETAHRGPDILGTTVSRQPNKQKVVVYPEGSPDTFPSGPGTEFIWTVVPVHLYSDGPWRPPSVVLLRVPSPSYVPKVTWVPSTSIRGSILGTDEEDTGTQKLPGSRSPVRRQRVGSLYRVGPDTLTCTPVRTGEKRNEDWTVRVVIQDWGVLDKTTER